MTDYCNISFNNHYIGPPRCHQMLNNSYYAIPKPKIPSNLNESFAAFNHNCCQDYNEPHKRQLRRANSTVAAYSKPLYTREYIANHICCSRNEPSNYNVYQNLREIGQNTHASSCPKQQASSCYCNGIGPGASVRKVNNSGIYSSIIYKQPAPQNYSIYRNLPHSNTNHDDYRKYHENQSLYEPIYRSNDSNAIYDRVNGTRVNHREPDPPLHDRPLEEASVAKSKSGRVKFILPQPSSRAMKFGLISSLLGDKNGHNSIKTYNQPGNQSPPDPNNNDSFKRAAYNNRSFRRFRSQNKLPCPPPAGHYDINGTDYGTAADQHNMTLYNKEVACEMGSRPPYHMHHHLDDTLSGRSGSSKGSSDRERQSLNSTKKLSRGNGSCCSSTQSNYHVHSRSIACSKSSSQYNNSSRCSVLNDETDIDGRPGESSLYGGNTQPNCTPPTRIKCYETVKIIPHTSEKPGTHGSIKKKKELRGDDDEFELNPQVQKRYSLIMKQRALLQETLTQKPVEPSHGLASPNPYLCQTGKPHFAFSDTNERQTKVLSLLSSSSTSGTSSMEEEYPPPLYPTPTTHNFNNSSISNNASGMKSYYNTNQALAPHHRYTPNIRNNSTLGLSKNTHRSLNTPPSTYPGLKEYKGSDLLAHMVNRFSSSSSSDHKAVDSLYSSKNDKSSCSGSNNIDRHSIGSIISQSSCKKTGSNTSLDVDSAISSDSNEKSPTQTEGFTELRDVRIINSQGCVASKDKKAPPKPPPRNCSLKSGNYLANMPQAKMCSYEEYDTYGLGDCFNIMKMEDLTPFQNVPKLAAYDSMPKDECFNDLTKNLMSPQYGLISTPLPSSYTTLSIEALKKQGKNDSIGEIEETVNMGKDCFANKEKSPQTLRPMLGKMAAIPLTKTLRNLCINSMNEDGKATDKTLSNKKVDMDAGENIGAKLDEDQASSSEDDFLQDLKEMPLLDINYFANQQRC